MKEVKIRLSGMYAEVLVRPAATKAHQRNSGRRSKDVKALALAEEDVQYQEEMKAHSLAGTKRKFRRLVYANFSNGYTLLTLTFNAGKCDFDVKDVATCRKKFTSYWDNLKRSERVSSNVDMRYLGVIEFQKSGAVHFHVLCHIPREYKALLTKKWQHGHLDFKQSDKNPISVQKIESYLNKGINDPRLQGEKHRYLASRGLEQSQVFAYTSNHPPHWLNEENSKLLYNKDSKYAFSYYQYITSLTPEEFEAYVEQADSEFAINMVTAMSRKLADM